MIIAAIAAGGSGTRMGGELPKQFHDLCGKPVIIRTIESLLSHPQVNAAVIGINRDYYELMQELIGRHLPHSPVYLTNGGSSRNQSIENIISYSLSELKCTDSDIILSHDAVRPFVTNRLIDDCIKAMDNYEICTAAIPEVDTVAVSENGSTADSFPDRKNIYRIQTPQTFRTGSFMSVYSSLSDTEKENATDVCSLYRLRGYRIGLVAGEISNIKLTYPHDMTAAKALIDSI